MKKSISKGIVLSAVSFLGVFAGSQVVSADTDVAIAKTSIVVKGYEFGPAVPKVVVKLDSKVSKVSKENVTVTTAGTERQVSKVYLSDKNGKKLPKIVSTSLFKCQLLLTPNQILVLPVLSFTTWKISIIHG